MYGTQNEKKTKKNMFQERARSFTKQEEKDGEIATSGCFSNEYSQYICSTLSISLARIELLKPSEVHGKAYKLTFSVFGSFIFVFTGAWHPRHPYIERLPTF